MTTEDKPNALMPDEILVNPYTPMETDRGTYGAPYCACCEPVKYTRADLSEQPGRVDVEKLKQTIGEELGSAWGGNILERNQMAINFAIDYIASRNLIGQSVGRDYGAALSSLKVIEYNLNQYSLSPEDSFSSSNAVKAIRDALSQNDGEAT